METAQRAVLFVDVTDSTKIYESLGDTVALALINGVFARLEKIARRAFRVLQCRDYARIDVRMDAEGRFYVLEMNPNPYLNSLALVNGLVAIGRSHEWQLVEMVLAALARGGKDVPAGAVRVPPHAVPA